MTASRRCPCGRRVREVQGKLRCRRCGVAVVWLAVYDGRVIGVGSRNDVFVDPVFRELLGLPAEGLLSRALGAAGK